MENGRASLEFVIIRHGRTPGNEQRRYVGTLDEPLSEAGCEQARAQVAKIARVLPSVERVYVSALRRTHETAAILFPFAEQVVVEGVQEMDFGDFAGKTADEMAACETYRAWVDGWCEGRCPNGESKAEFTERVCAGIEHMLRDARDRGERQVVLVAHEGTMMASLSRFSDDDRAYFAWNAGNCEGYRVEVTFDNGAMRFSDVENL